MCATVVIVGIPQYITSYDVAQSLTKLLDARTGSFQVRDLRESTYRIYKWQFALDFDSVYEATTAQKILHGYNYLLPNGTAYVLCAKITEDPILIRNENSLVPIANSISSNCDGDWAIVGLVPKVPVDEIYATCTSMDAQIEFLKKQKLLVQAERELLRERRQLWRDYNRKDDSDSDHERRRYRSPRRRRNMSRSRERSRSRYLRDSTRIRSISMHRDFPNDGLVLPEMSSCKNSTYSGSSVVNQTSYDEPLQELRSNCVEKEIVYKTTVNNYYNMDTIVAETKKNDPPKQKCKDAHKKIEISETIRKIIKEMDAILDQVCYEKNINILDKGLNVTIIRKIKDIIRERIERFKITSLMYSSSLTLYYKRFYNVNDDKQLVEKLVDEYLVKNPHIQKKCIESNDLSEASVNYLESEENSMWRAVDEVLQDIDIEMLSSEYDEETNLNVKNEIKRTQMQRSENYIENDKNIINPNPIFYITVKVILKQMKQYIEEFEQTTGVTDFKITVGTHIRNKLIELLKGKDYMKSANITKLFREVHPRSNDRDFIKGVAETAIKEKKIITKHNTKYQIV